MFVKYCGFTREKDLEFAISCNIDAVGFIFYKKSKRYISPERALQLIKNTNSKNVLKVGIFFDSTANEILEVSKIAGLDRLQIYDPKLFNELNKSYPIIRAYQIKSEQDLKKIENPQKNDLLLLDSFHDIEKGGTGHTFDWRFLKQFPYLSKTLIAGGINSSNIKNLLDSFQPYGIDVSSGIEISPGIKSETKMNELITKINQYK
jgi:phosphoribosylanthranilate isomerase